MGSLSHNFEHMDAKGEDTKIRVEIGWPFFEDRTFSSS